VLIRGYNLYIDIRKQYLRLGGEEKERATPSTCAIGPDGNNGTI